MAEHDRQRSVNRPMISNESARIALGGAAAEGLFSNRSQEPSGDPPAPPLAQAPSASSPPPAFNPNPTRWSRRAVVVDEPARRSRQPVVVREEAYFHSDDYPFTARLLDRTEEDKLGANTTLDGKKGLPLMNIADSQKQLSLSAGGAKDLEEWDLECAKKHLEAVKESLVTHEELQSFLLMDGEVVDNVLDLAGLKAAPGLYNDVTQNCRLVFTSDKRLVFTQANHSAEVGVPKMRCLTALLTCFHDRWSHRTWHSYYAAINASEVLQVFVQQTLTTKYDTSKCSFNDVFDVLCCPAGGKMISQKDIDGVTQTLGDHDPGECMSKWDKTRHMRHALVIRYIDCATSSVAETVAFATPSTRAADLFKMAKVIEASITLRAADYFKEKRGPNYLIPRAFHNKPPPLPLFKRKSYKITSGVLLVVALIFFAFSTIAAVLMLFAVLLSLGGSYSTRNRKGKAAGSQTGSAVGFLSAMFSGGPSLAVVGTTGPAVVLYLLGFLFGISNASTTSAAASAYSGYSGYTGST